MVLPSETDGRSYILRESGSLLLIVCELMFIDEVFSGSFFCLFAYLSNMTRMREHDAEESVLSQC